MKVRLKSTNEVLNVADYNMVTLDKCDSYGNPIQVPMEDIDNVYDNDGHPIGIPKLQVGGILSVENNIDWEQRRYELAKEAMTAIMSNECFYKQVLDEGAEKGERCIMKSISKASIEFADALIEELKKERK